MRVFVFSVLLALAMLGRAHASPPATLEEKTEQARAHVKAGIAYYDDGRYEDAAREMRVAYELRPLADLQYNLAQCYERLNQLEEAAAAYEIYLQGVTNAPDRKAVEARVAHLRERAKAQKEGAPPPPPQIVEKEKVVFKTIVVYKEAPPKPGRAARYAAYGLFVVGAAGVATGIAFAVLAQQAANDVTNGGNVANPPPFDGDIRTTQASGKTYPIISGVSIGLGVLAIGGGIGLYLIGNKIDKEAPKLTFTPLLGPQGGALLVGGRF